jgi:D-alanyl-lipoteichoic acid acyltransferase DltB (MBOAT superfamily)
MYGLFLKVVLADHVGYWVDMGYSQPSEFISALDVWTLGFMFGFQVYFDFSAYSHIAIGSARMMGVKLPENFNFPLIATSPRDLWGRWHISLSSWIRDYMYLPLAGLPVQDRSTGGLAGATAVEQKSTPGRRNFSLFATWGLMGLWHGAAWTTVAWGLIHAVYVFFYRIMQPWFRGWPEVVRRFGGWAITLGVFMFALVPFRSESIPQMFTMVGHVFNPTKYSRLGLLEDTYVLAALLLVGCTGAYWIHELVLPRLRRHRFVWLALETVAFCVIIVSVFIFLRPIRQFIYFEF